MRRVIQISCAVLAVCLIANQRVDPTAPGFQTGRTSTSDSTSELELLLDPIFTEQMASRHIPGAVVAIVKNGKIVFTKGYGYADIDQRTPVVPDKTIFRIGSITKVFTATAVLQMADRKKIDLREDVNKYLTSFKVPSTYALPITFDNLLTHTSGLDEISPGRRTSDESKVIPLGEFLKTRLVRIRPPSEVISYSTYNPALAALILEELTQTPFKLYLARNIFAPLEMNRTSITAVKVEYKQDLASGYEYDGKNYQKLPFQWFNTYPASDINSTATDMARFILANLSGGALDGRRILTERALRQMHATHFRNHPNLSGWAYGFYEGLQNNLRFVEHGGSMDDGYSALLTMFPEQNLGLFVGCNTETGGFGLGEAVKAALLDRYFPVHITKKTTPRKPIASRAALERFAGKYRPNIYCHSCPRDSGVYFPEPIEVKVNEDGTLSFQNGKWRQVEPLLFELISDKRSGLLAFRENPKGEITDMFQEAYRAYERVSR